MAVVVAALLGACCLLICHLSYSLHRNIKACQKSGIPYVVLPFNPYSIPAVILAPLWQPLLRLLPSSLKGGWQIFMNPGLPWDELYAPFREAGSDTILTCSPTDTMLHTCAADVVSQVVDRKNDFPKPTHIYSIIDIYGKSAISVEGQLWRKHHKVTAGPFNEKNNRIVWSESIFQAQELIKHVLPLKAGTSADLDDIEMLTSRTALAIVSKAGYGVRMNWPEADGAAKRHSAASADLKSDSELGADWVEGRTNGHEMSYESALFSVSNDVFWLFALPRSLLKYLPWKSARRASQAYVDWGQYMREMVGATRRQQQRDEKEAPSTAPNVDLLSSLVRNAKEAEDFVEDETTGSGKIGVGGFSDEEIMGNLFLLIMAGHETTAGVLHMTLLLLAMNVDAQRAMQRDIDRVFGGRDPSQWDYKQDFNELFNGTVGAVLAEVLRWMPPVTNIPKWTTKEQTLEVDGRTCFVPANTIITMHTPAAHRNPNQWPHGPPSNPSALEHPRSNPADDLGEFRPERWLLKGSGDGKDQPALTSDGSSPPAFASGLPAGLYRPPKGAYFPFSEGHRACLGRRFSQVEMMAMLAVIFQQYSVELAVEKWAEDAQIDAMDQDERRTLWTEARDSAAHKLRHDMKFLMTNKLFDTHIPVRIVLRGKERFQAGNW